MFETFDHTADLGMRVTAPTELNLYVEAAKGLLSMLVENPEAVEPRTTFELSIPGDTPDYLLFDWLSELLYRYETQKFLGCEFTLHRGPHGLRAVIAGESVDRTRHRLAHEVKAITYHDLIVRETADGWEAEFIVDI